MSLSNTATPIYYSKFRDSVLRGEIVVNEEISMEMNRIDDLIGLLEDAKPYLEKDNKFPDVRLSLVEKWLKSLRPPYYCDDCKLLKSVTGWKPKREQMYILNWVANILLNSNSIADQAASKTLNSLYDELKLLGERNC